MPFLLSSDKQVVNAVNQAAWSPGKDLIACLTQDSQLHAYREYPSFQRIWALSFQSKPTTLCWRPDGIRLAVGHEDGSLSIIDAENGNSEMQIRPQTEHGIACLAWASAPAKGSTETGLTHDMWNRYTRHCPWQGNIETDQAHTAAAKGAPDNKAPPLKQRDLEMMDILCIADTAGDICLAAFGHYTFLKFRLHDVLKTPIDGVVGPTPKCVPQTMLLCPAISRLFVTYGTQVETSKAGAGTLGMVVCSLDMVGSRLKELHSLLLIATELRHLHSACKAAMTRMLRSKQSARNTILKVFALFGSDDPSMALGGQKQWEYTKDMLRHELQALFSRGQITDQLHVFLTTRPGEHGLKQAARTCDAALSTAHAASLQLHSAVQSISFLLEELSGLLTASPAYASCNISTSEVISSQVKALQLLVRLEALKRDITSTAQLHRVFFQRLATASRSASGQGSSPDMASNSDPGEEQHALQTFLQYHLETDSLMSEMQEDRGRSGTETAEMFSTNRKPLAPRNAPVALRLMGMALGHPEPSKHVSPAALSSVVDSLGQGLQALFSHLPEALRTGVAPQCKKKSDSVAHISMQYDPAQPVISSMCGAVLDVSQHDSKQMVVDAHPFQEGALVLLTKATGEDGVFTSRRSRGKENMEGVISLVPCPFEESVLVPLHSAIQQDVLQELVGGGGLVKLEDIADVGSRSTPSGQVNPPLAVSVARGLATVCAEQRITVYDLLDAEDGEGEEEEENGAAASDGLANSAPSQTSDDIGDDVAM